MVDRLEGAGRPEGSMARRDLVALVASTSLRGATVAGVDSTVDRIVTSVGSRAETDKGREPRWRRGDVLSVARERGSELTVRSEREVAPSAAVDRRAGRERETARHLDRTGERRRERGRDHGLGL
jgi:hypothetical protein